MTGLHSSVAESACAAAAAPAALHIVPAAAVSVVFKVKGDGNLPNRLFASLPFSSSFLSGVSVVSVAAAAQEFVDHSFVLINSYRSATSISARRSSR